MKKLPQQDLKYFLAKGKTRIVLDNLLHDTKAHSNLNLYNEVVLQSAIYEQYQEIVRKGVISSNDMQVLFSKINDALIQLIDRLHT